MISLKLLQRPNSLLKSLTKVRLYAVNVKNLEKENDELKTTKISGKKVEEENDNSCMSDKVETLFFRIPRNVQKERLLELFRSFNLQENDLRVVEDKNITEVDGERIKKENTDLKPVFVDIKKKDQQDFVKKFNGYMLDNVKFDVTIIYKENLFD
ncbi:hypothetical protein HK099_002392 [Clydaea vesicula]|uniref:Uncharacterized protein n=1 Tax=Clydaea vesicula TaxID=447962 RepID=A0AAD5U491_9FUNG|nr:hypothetical protein HK099_002392 [Clydaea vesicula]